MSFLKNKRAQYERELKDYLHQAVMLGYIAGWVCALEYLQKKSIEGNIKNDDLR